MYPARTRNLWLATSASAGASRSVGINSCDQRYMMSFDPRWRIFHSRGWANLFGVQSQEVSQLMHRPRLFVYHWLAQCLVVLLAVQFAAAENKALAKRVEQ